MQGNQDCTLALSFVALWLVYTLMVDLLRLQQKSQATFSRHLGLGEAFVPMCKGIYQSTSCIRLVDLQEGSFYIEIFSECKQERGEVLEEDASLGIGACLAPFLIRLSRANMTLFRWAPQHVLT